MPTAAPFPLSFSLSLTHHHHHDYNQCTLEARAPFGAAVWSSSTGSTSASGSGGSRSRVLGSRRIGAMVTGGDDGVSAARLKRMAQPSEEEEREVRFYFPPSNLAPKYRCHPHGTPNHPPSSPTGPFLTSSELRSTQRSRSSPCSSRRWHLRRRARRAARREVRRVVRKGTTATATATQSGTRRAVWWRGVLLGRATVAERWATRGRMIEDEIEAAASAAAVVALAVAVAGSRAVAERPRHKPDRPPLRRCSSSRSY